MTRKQDFRTGKGTRAEVKHRGRTLSFAVDNPQDVVQRNLLRGSFYELGQLQAHTDFIYNHSTVLDVGANIGNHTVFYSFTRAARVYPFEPNPRANRLLRTTVEENKLDSVDLTYLEHGIGSKPGELFVETPGENNLGRTFLRAQGEIKVPVARLDDLSFQGPVSFIKIDVEGMEMDALEGAAALIQEHRPGIAIEVNMENTALFWAWVDENDYHVVRAIRDGMENINYLCTARY